MQVTINFDMDGTIADLYSVHDWLRKLRSYDATPYMDAKPLVNMSLLARYLNKLQKNGCEIVIISWLSKNSTKEYDIEVIKAKEAWLRKHLPSVSFDTLRFLPHGTPKEQYASAESILFDDEEQNREHWGQGAYAPEEIFKVLKAIIAQGE